MNSLTSILLEPLGLIRNPHRDPDRDPDRPRSGEETTGEVLLDPRFARSFRALRGFRHLLLLYLPHREPPGTPRVQPDLPGTIQGPFSRLHFEGSRALGLSLVRLLGARGCRLVFTGADLPDGALLLGLRPWCPGGGRPELTWTAEAGRAESPGSILPGPLDGEPGSGPGPAGPFLPYAPYC